MRTYANVRLHKTQGVALSLCVCVCVCGGGGGGKVEMEKSIVDEEERT